MIIPSRCCVGCVIVLALVAQGVTADESAAGPAKATAASHTVASQVPSDGKGDLNALPARAPTSARSLLINVDESDLEHFVDREPLGVADEETLIRILYRIPAIRLHIVQQLIREKVSWSELVAEPDKHRAEFFRLRGYVTGVTRVPILAEVAERLEFDHYFRVTWECDSSPHPMVICARQIPAAWLQTPPTRERAATEGLFIKVGDVTGQHPQLVFAAQRIGWFPEQESPEAGIHDDQVYLGGLGFDVSLLDEVRQTNYREVTARDGECFYQLLAAMRQTDLTTLSARASQDFSLKELLSDPRPLQGELGTVRGVARRVTKVLVTDPEVRQRFQIDHYYQIDVFLLLGDQVIRVVPPGSKDKKGPQYSGTFPVTICALRLPPELPESLNPRREVRVPAAFFKIWSYKSDFVTAAGTGQSQRSPMFIALEPVVLPRPIVSNPAKYLPMAALVLLAGFLWFGVVRPSLRRRTENPAVAIQSQATPAVAKDGPVIGPEQPSSGIKLNEIKINPAE